MKSYEERTKDNQYKIDMFRTKQGLPYEAKVKYAAIRVREFYDHMEGQCFVSVGGLDSITLLMFIRSLHIDVPAVSVSSLEDTDENGNPCGWGRVLEYIGVEWRQEMDGQMHWDDLGGQP